MTGTTPPLEAGPGNQVWLSASLLEKGPPRYTPAGLPALNLVLRHEGQAAEAGAWRKVSFEIRAVAFGAQATDLGRWALGQSGQFAGFLAATRNGKGVVLHLTSAAVTAVTEPDPDQ